MKVLEVPSLRSSLHGCCPRQFYTTVFLLSPAQIRNPHANRVDGGGRHLLPVTFLPTTCQDDFREGFSSRKQADYGAPRLDTVRSVPSELRFGLGCEELRAGRVENSHQSRSFGARQLVFLCSHNRSLAHASTQGWLVAVMRRFRLPTLDEYCTATMYRCSKTRANVEMSSASSTTNLYPRRARTGASPPFVYSSCCGSVAFEALFYDSRRDATVSQL